MNRIVLGAFGALLLMATGMFWWQGRAAINPGKLPPVALAAPGGGDISLPTANGLGQKGPAIPEASEQSKEARRFDRLDRNRDGRIVRVEALAPRAAAFRKLDVDGNNLLTFEEWAVRTSNKFKGADANGDGQLDRPEFAATKPRPHRVPDCKCGATASKGPRKPIETPSDDDGEPAQ